MTWLRFGFGPELGRIEDALYADFELFGGSQTYPGFDTQGFVRGDLLTEATILVSRVQAGIETPNEARQTLGLPRDDDPNSDKLQVTPVGGKENPLPAIAPKKGKPSAAGGDPDADTKSVTVPSIELRVEQDMNPLASTLDRHLERVDAMNERFAGLSEAASQRARELEAAREARSLRHEKQFRDVTSASLGAIEAAQQPEIHLHVEPTPVSVHNHVPEQKPPEVHIHEAAPAQMEIEFGRDGYGLIKSATSKPKKGT